MRTPACIYTGRGASVCIKYDMSFVWDLIQDRRIRNASTDAREATIDADNAQLLLAQTERKLARLSLVTEALWNVLKSREDCTDEELVAEMTRLDLTDGAVDGRKRNLALTCKACGRSTPQASLRCMYCGEELQTHSPFAGL